MARTHEWRLQAGCGRSAWRFPLSAVADTGRWATDGTSDRDWSRLRENLTLRLAIDGRLCLT